MQTKTTDFMLITKSVLLLRQDEDAYEILAHVSEVARLNNGAKRNRKGKKFAVNLACELLSSGWITFL